LLLGKIVLFPRWKRGEMIIAMQQLEIKGVHSFLPLFGLEIPDW